MSRFLSDSVEFLPILLTGVKLTVQVTIGSLAHGRWQGEVSRITLLGGGTVPYSRDGTGLHLDLPRGQGIVPVVRVEGRGVSL